MAKHIEGCLNKKQEKQRKKKEAKDARDAAARKEKNAANGVADSDDEDDNNNTADGKRREAGSKTGLGGSGGSSSKKRKAGDTGDALENTPETNQPAKKKSKKSGTSGGGGNANDKSKAARPKAPVDVEKQCGVELPQGGQCARSLTCKSHSMGAKRAVPGRSAPYDKLLMEYQRKNQAKLQKAQFDASAPDPEDEALGNGGPVDSEEERDAVMGAIGRCWGGKPIWNHTMVPLRARYQHNRIRGMLQSAFPSGNKGLLGGGGGFFGAANGNASVSATAAGSAAAGGEDGSAVPAPRRGSVVPGARSMMAPSSRKASVVNAATAVGA
jgi:SAGA-associated factor 73